MEGIRIGGGQVFTRALEEDGKRIIAGYASVEVKDSFGTIITTDALRAALPDYMKNPVLRYQHQPEPIGKVLWRYVTQDGKVLETGVDNRGLFIVAEIINDPAATRANEVWALIKAGIITGFSVGGEMVETMQRGGDTYITKIRLYEISVVDLPANDQSHFRVYRQNEITEKEIGLAIKDWLERKRYPWDQCIKDMKKQGHSDESAARICAAIKNRTVRHMLEYGLARTYTEAYELLIRKLQEDPIFAYVIRRLHETSTELERKLYKEGEHIVGQDGVNMTDEIERQDAQQAGGGQEQAAPAPAAPNPLEERVSALEQAVSDINTTLADVVQQLADLKAMLTQEQQEEQPAPPTAPEGEVAAGMMTERKGAVKEDEQQLDVKSLERSKRVELLAEYEKQRW